MAPGEVATSSGSEARSTHFVFDHPVFRAAGAKFLLASDGEPALVLHLSEFDAVVPLKSLRAEFGLNGTPDGELLDKVVAGLKFIKMIRPGDSIPREILDGTASWQVLERHSEIARSRISVQISGWLSGNETVISDHDQLLQLAEDPTVKARVTEAFGEIAKRLSIPVDRKQEVVDRIDQVVRELSYIEALRDRYALVRMVNAKVNQFIKIYRRDRTIEEELGRISNLLRRPVGELNGIFEQVDANCGEIISLLRNLPRQVQFIRESRDELHMRLMLWDDLLPKWDKITIERAPENEAAMKELYRFLARNYLVDKPWQLSR